MNAERKAAIAGAMAHPLRWQVVGELASLERENGHPPRRSPSELAEILDAPLGNVSYHVRQLAKAGILAPAGEAPRRGAVEHYYRLKRLPELEVSALP